MRCSRGHRVAKALRGVSEERWHNEESQKRVLVGFFSWCVSCWTVNRLAYCSSVSVSVGWLFVPFRVVRFRSVLIAHTQSYLTEHNLSLIFDLVPVAMEGALQTVQKNNQGTVKALHLCAMGPHPQKG